MCWSFGVACQNILSHTHARNNRAMLFNLACALIIHLSDMVILEDARIAGAVKKLHEGAEAKVITLDIFSKSDRTAKTASNPGARKASWNGKSHCGSLYDATTDLVMDDILRVGRILRETAEKQYGKGANGTHFVQTVLFECLLSTIGFHVLSRTAHTDISEAFWFRHNDISHSTNHLKYQELSIFFAFFRGIIPTVAVEELYTRKPGRSVMRLPSFTGRFKNAFDGRGWTYVHKDEGLEMLIVRHLKGLSVNFLGHLEDSTAWLLQVSKFRAFCRYMTGASRAFGSRRLTDDEGEAPGPIGQFDRNACQWRTVARMLHVMRGAGFLNVSHRGCEWLCNVFSSPPVRMNISKDQDMLLNIAERGKATSELHASVLFPDVFGPLTAEDKEKYFSGLTFKKWTRARTVLRPAQSMIKINGMATLHSEAIATVSAHHSHDSSPSFNQLTSIRRSNAKESCSKILNERRRRLSKMKDTLYLQERKAAKVGDQRLMTEVMYRWDMIHQSRHLISPFADRFLDCKRRLNHGAKSRFAKYGGRGIEDTVYPLNGIHKKILGTLQHREVSTVRLSRCTFICSLM